MLKKVWDRCHISRKYRYALCSSCNLMRAKRPFQVKVFFHGLSKLQFTLADTEVGGVQEIAH